MTLITYISLLIFSLSSPSIKSPAVSNQLNGTWLPVKQELGGVSLPKTIFESSKLILSDSTYIVNAESVDKGIVKYDEEKMDIYGKIGVNAGKHFTAIYKYENDELSICYNLSGDKYPESFETKGQPKYFLSVFMRE